MGDYADGKRSTNLSTKNSAAAQHKPLPNGSSSKPSARHHSEKPRPKKSGVMFDAHHSQNLTEPATAAAQEVNHSVNPPVETSHKLGNFLNSEQRQRVETLFVARVLAAQVSYTTVLSEMHAENLVRKPEELSIWTALFITVVGKVAEYAIMQALMDLKKVGTAVEKLKDAQVTEVKEGEVEGKILGLHEKTVEGLVATGVDKTKEKTTEKAAEAKNEAGQEEQAAEGSYIDYLQDNSMMMFQHLREDRLSSKSDAELLCAMVAFEGFRHNHSVYRAKLKAHIDLFMGSHAKDIGHKIEDKERQKYGDHGGIEHFDVRKETRVAWLIDGRAQPQLVYMAKEFEPDDNHGIGNSPYVDYPDVEVDAPGAAYTTSENALGLEEEGTWQDSEHGGTRMSHRPEVEPEFLGPVEEELQLAALAAHKRRWLQPPQTIMRGPYGWIVVS